MQGKVLGVDEAGGVITGADGQRYKFVAAQWKGARSAAPGETVDFDVEGAMALAIYPVPGAAPLNVDLGQLGAQAREVLAAGAASPLTGQVLAVLRRDIKAPLAVLTLLICLLFNILVIGGEGPAAMMRMALPHGGKIRLVQSGSAIKFAGAGLKSAADGMKGMSEYMTGADAMFGDDNSEEASAYKAQMKKAKASIDGLRLAGVILPLLYFLYLIPIGAVAILVQAVRGRNTALLALGVGALSVLAFVVLLLGKGMVVSTMESMTGGLGGAMLDNIIQLGFGAWLLLLTGLALIGAALGLVRMPAPAPANMAAV